MRLVRRRRRRLGRHHRRRQVPRRRILRAAGRRRPLRRRPSEELYSRRSGDRFRQPLRPLALDRAGRHRHHPGPRHLVARPARRSRAAGRRRHAQRRLRPLSQRRHHRRDAARFRRRLRDPDAGARGPTALRPRREQVVLAGSRVVVGPAGADDHPRGRQPAGGRDRRRVLQRRLAPRRPAGRGLGWGAGLRDPLRRHQPRRRPGGADRVRLRQGLDRGRVARDADAALRARRPRLPGDRYDDLQRRAARGRPLRHRLRRQRRLHGAADGPDRQQRPRPSALAVAGRRRGLAPGRRLRPQLGEPRPGAGEPDRRRRLAPDGAGGIRLRDAVRRRPRPRRPRRRLGAGRRRLLAAALAARRGRQRGALLGCRRAAALRRRGAERRLRGEPGGGCLGAAAGRGRRCPLRPRRRHYLLPPRRLAGLGRAADQAAPRCRHRPPAGAAARPRARHLPVPRRGLRRRRQHRDQHPARRRHPDGDPPGGAGRGREGEDSPLRPPARRPRSR